MIRARTGAGGDRFLGLDGDPDDAVNSLRAFALVKAWPMFVSVGR